MEAVILCAGKGLRLYPMTEDRPKCLLKVGEKTLLEYAVEALKAEGIEHIRLVTGYLRNRIKELVDDKGYTSIQYTVNPDFATTNTAFSLNLALKHQEDDLILLNGDVLFDSRILKELIAHPEENCVVVDRDMYLNEEEVKVVASNGRIQRIGKDLDPRMCIGEAIGINKISYQAGRRLCAVFDELEGGREFQHFFEKGFDVLCCDHGRFGILPISYPWVEIDTPEDFRSAVEEIYPRILNR